MQVKVKICGLTTPAAVDAAVKGGASHVGFWFSRQPRADSVSVEQAAELAARVPGHVRKVGVFFEHDSIFAMTAISAARLHILQLHATDPRQASNLCGVAGRAAWGVVPVATAKDLRKATQWQGWVDRILYELKPPEVAASERAAPEGATAARCESRCDWKLLQGITHPLPWTLGGGLDETNVADAIATTGARMIDVSSGVESEPGVKDPAKISAFLDVVRSVSVAHR